MGFMSGSLKSRLQIRAGKKCGPKEQRETVGSLDTLCWTWSMVTSFRERGPGTADTGRMKRRDF